MKVSIVLDQTVHLTFPSLFLSSSTLLRNLRPIRWTFSTAQVVPRLIVSSPEMLCFSLSKRWLLANWS